MLIKQNNQGHFKKKSIFILFLTLLQPFYFYSSDGEESFLSIPYHDNPMYVSLPQTGPSTLISFNNPMYDTDLPTTDDMGSLLLSPRRARALRTIRKGEPLSSESLELDFESAFFHVEKKGSNEVKKVPFWVEALYCNNWQATIQIISKTPALTKAFYDGKPFCALLASQKPPFATVTALFALIKQVEDPSTCLLIEDAHGNLPFTHLPQSVSYKTAHFFITETTQELLSNAPSEKELSYCEDQKELLYARFFNSNCTDDRIISLIKKNEIEEPIPLLGTLQRIITEERYHAFEPLLEELAHYSPVEINFNPFFSYCLFLLYKKEPKDFEQLATWFFKIFIKKYLTLDPQKNPRAVIQRIFSLTKIMYNSEVPPAPVLDFLYTELKKTDD